MLHELYIKKMVHMSGGRTFLNDAWIKDSWMFLKQAACLVIQTLYLNCDWP